ncbi:MAG: hypothetical protein Aurels2KO_16890 [Aureliella sp.]
MLLAIACNSGCDNSADAIRVYTVPKADIKQPRMAGGQDSQSSSRRMLGVIVPKDDAAWFYKLTGDVDLVEEQLEDFRKIVGSTQFSGASPEWKMPEGWKSKLEGGMTYARWQHIDSGLEATVTMLPVPNSYDGVEGWQDYVAMNVNRWRGQLSLATQEWPDMEGELEEISDLSAETRPAYLVSLQGRGSGGMQAPFMNSLGSSPTGTSASGSSTADTPEQTTAAVKRQMLGAIVPESDKAWFFKLTGAIDLVEDQADSFLEIVNSTEFTGDDIRWKMADGWESESVGGMTHSRWRHAESGLEATVTLLGVTDEFSTVEGWQDYVAKNVNRWRGQLSLNSQDWSELESELDELSEFSTETQKAYFVSLIGEGTGAMKPPFMNANSAGKAAQPDSKRTPSPATQPSEQADNSSPQFQFETPAGWTEEKPKSSMRLVQFAVTKLDTDPEIAKSEDESAEESSAELIISRAGGAIEMNMSMWLGQVGSESSEESANKIIDAGKSRSVNNVDAKLYSLAGPNGKSILLTEIPQQTGYSVFVKLIGPTQIVESQRENYLEFLDSLSW